MKTFQVIILVLFVALSGCVRSTGASRNTGSLGSMDAHEIELRLNLAESHLTNNQPNFALQELQKVADAASNLSRFHFDMGLTYLQLQENEKSYEGFARSVELDPYFAEGWNDLGRLAEMLNKPQEAEADYRKALAILTYATPEFPAYNLGSLYLKQNRPREAEEFARKALARNWRYTPAYKLLADAMDAQGRTAEAEEVLRKGLEGDLSSATLSLALAEHQIKAGKNAEAKVLFEQIIKQNPRSNEAKVAKDYLDFLQ